MAKQGHSRKTHVSLGDMLLCNLTQDLQLEFIFLNYFWHKTAPTYGVTWSNEDTNSANNYTRHAAAAATAKSLQLCPTLCDPIDGSPRLPCPWDSPGKNTGVGCHFLLQCMKVKSQSEVAQSCLTLTTPWTAAYFFN